MLELISIRNPLWLFVFICDPWMDINRQNQNGENQRFEHDPALNRDQIADIEDENIIMVHQTKT